MTMCKSKYFYSASTRCIPGWCMNVSVYVRVWAGSVFISLVSYKLHRWSSFQSESVGIYFKYSRNLSFKTYLRHDITVSRNTIHLLFWKALTEAHRFQCSPPKPKGTGWVVCWNPSGLSPHALSPHGLSRYWWNKKNQTFYQAKTISVYPMSAKSMGSRSISAYPISIKSIRTIPPNELNITGDVNQKQDYLAFQIPVFPRAWSHCK